MKRSVGRLDERSRGGVSLVEVLVVLTILGVLAGAVAPSLRTEPPEDDLQSATREVRQLADRTRRSAIDHGVPVTLVVDAAGSRYWVIAAFPGNDSIVASGSLPLPPGVELVSPAVRASVRFAPTGASSSRDAIVLRGNGRSVRIATASWHGKVPRNGE